MKQLYDYQLKTNDSFKEACKKSIESPQDFWGEIASTFKWQQPWDDVVRYDWSIPKTEWFLGGEIKHNRKLSRSTCCDTSREGSNNLGT